MKNRQDYIGANYSVEDICDGDKVPVGGTNMLGGPANVSVEADFGNLAPMFEQLQQARVKIKPDGLAAWLTETNINVEPDLFAAAYVFQRVLAKYYPDISANADTDRMAFYKAGKQPKLSEIVGAKSAECAEIALLAHAWLNRQGVPNQYFSGHVMFDRNFEFAGAHSFIVIPRQDSTLIFDPANATETPAGGMPSLYRVTSPDQLRDWEQARDKQSAFLVLTNEISGAEALFGVSTETSIDPQRHFFEPTAPVTCERPNRMPGGVAEGQPRS